MRARLICFVCSVVGCGGSTMVNAPLGGAIASPTPSPTPSDLPAVSPELATPPPSPLALATRVESFYASALPFECDLAVETYKPLQRSHRQSRLHVVYAQKGRFHIAMPGGAFIAVDGQKEMMFDPRTQMASQRAVSADHCPIALSYAAGPGALAGHLSLESRLGASMSAPGMDILIGRPPVRSSSLASLVFFVEATGLVKRSLFVLPTGDRHRYDTVSCNMHITPPASLFGFRPPSIPNMNILPGAPLLLTEALP